MALSLHFLALIMLDNIYISSSCSWAVLAFQSEIFNNYLMDLLSYSQRVDLKNDFIVQDWSIN